VAFYFFLNNQLRLKKERIITMPDILVLWYDDYGNSHNSPVYCIDSVRDRFLVVTGGGNFHWVSTSDCELLMDDD
jgi:hypothetical protein